MVKKLREHLPEWGYKVVGFISMIMAVIGTPLTIWGLTIMLDMNSKLSILDGIPEKVNKHESQIAVINDRLKIGEKNYGFYQKTLGVDRINLPRNSYDIDGVSTAIGLRFADKQVDIERQSRRTEHGSLQQNRPTVGRKGNYKPTARFVLYGSSCYNHRPVKLSDSVLLYGSAISKISKKDNEGNSR